MRTIHAAVLLVALAALLAGCGVSDRNERNIRMQETAPGNEIDTEDVGARLERLAESIEQVNDANVVVVGKTAIVGIDVDGNLDRSRVDVLKFTVAEALKKDPYGVNAVVTADLDMNARLKEIADDIRNGRPIAGFVNELGDMIGRIMPQLPSDLLPREEQPPNASEDKKKLQEDSL
jgi:YhcN/YlaJ family sporulation lipoprotein